MFKKEKYIKRREELKSKLNNGILLFLGNNESPMNYPANPYKFRQDSNFLYFFGIDRPGFAGIIDLNEDKEIIFGNDFEIDDIVWMGPQPKVKDLAEQVGVKNTKPYNKLINYLQNSINKGINIHFLPQYRADKIIEISDLLGISHNFVNKYSSLELTKAVISLREIKDDEEVKEIEQALNISYLMYDYILNNIKPGIYERELAGAIEGIVSSFDALNSFPTILSINGQILHNHSHGNKLSDGDLLIIDSGAESPNHYASDITRTFPASRKFTSKQKDIYQIVLKSQIETINAIAPGKKYKEIHLLASEIIAQGLKDLGLLKGNVDDIVEKGAHALFFPHGLGHMLGLDVHDMEGLGENYVGYNDEEERSTQFGINFLRLAKSLKPGFVLTVEPGIYFIPQLFELWRKENKLKDFINYNKVEEYLDFGGIRIEDDILVTSNGSRVLGKPIPKEINEIEK